MRTRQTPLVFGSPQISADDIAAVQSTLSTGWIGTGPQVALFEDQFGQFKGTSNATAVSSCTAALHLSTIAAGLGPGDEVITTPLTFCATVNAIIHSGATPVLADVDDESMNIDPQQLAAAISARTRAIVPVHFAGRPCNMDAIMAVADLHGLAVIEDCAHAIEATYHGRPIGTIGDFGCFSFYVTKSITTVEGGMVLAKDQRHTNRIRTLALHGLSADAWARFADADYVHYMVVEAGYKYNMTDVQATIGLSQLARIESMHKRRLRVWAEYQRGLPGLGLKLPAEPDANTTHAYHLYTIRIDEAAVGLSRNRFMQRLHSMKIGSGVHYLSLPEHPYYQARYGWRPEDYPIAMSIGRETVSLPLGSGMTDDDVDDVIAAVTTILG